MQPIQITIRDIPKSDALEDHIRKRAQKLNQFYQRINNCRIVINLLQKHKHQGKLFNVRIDLTVPGKELVINHKKDEDVYVAIRDAFKAAERQLEGFSEKHRGYIKHHTAEVHGKIKRIFHEENYGFIEGLQGEEYYFSMANVACPTFEQLRIGDSVAFISTVASDGLQANRITKVKSNHVVEE